MKTQIKALNLELLPGIEAYINRRFKALEPLFKRYGASCAAYLEVSKISRHHQSGDVYRAELRLDIPGPNLYVWEEEADLKSAVKAVMDDLKMQVAKNKGRKVAHDRKVKKSF